MTSIGRLSETTYYDILNVSLNDNTKQLSKQDLTQSYHRALLLHHPDKLNGVENMTPMRQTEPRTKVYSIDEITIAYKTLSDHTLRADYDKHLRTLQQQSNTRGLERPFHTGLETVDLDDMNYDDTQETWNRSCRCGDSRGFQITEIDLEKACEDGEVVAGCKGCSLWLRVLFALSE
jgi:diphthamide biosynthesis protein 4